MKLNLKAFNANFLLLLAGRMVSDTGTGIQAVIIPLYIIDSGGSAATLGLFSFLSLVPALVVYPLAGVWGDRSNRKFIMVASDLASAVILLSLAYTAYVGRMSLTLLLSVQVIVSMLYGFFDPATKGMMPELVEQPDLNPANSTFASARILSALLGPVIGSILYANLGVSILIFINGLSFLVSAGFSMLIKYQHVKPESAVGVPGLVKDLGEGIRFILSNQLIRRLCIFFLIVFAVIQPVFTVVLPLFFKTRLDYSDIQYGYLQTILILGAMLGSILVGVLFSKAEDLGKSLAIGCGLLMGAMLGFSLLLFPFSLSALGRGTPQYFVLLAGALGLLSVAIMLINVPVQTLIQTATPNQYMSRIFSIVGLISKGGMPFGALIYGVILNLIEVHLTVLTAALLMVLIAGEFLIKTVGTIHQSA